MSWLNNSLNTIKGQLTNLAQEVLAETAGPGDEEYRGPAVSNNTALELLAETQKEKEDYEKQCGEQGNEIALLRKQITELQNKISDTGSGGGGGTATAAATGRASKSPADNNVALEDSWCWEPENAKSDNGHSSDGSSSGNGNEMVNITLEEAPLGSTGRTTKRAANERNTSELQRHILQLETENKQLNAALEELDSQHNLAMQNVLELKTDLQEKLTKVTSNYETLKKEHADKFINSELDMGRLEKKCEILEKNQQSADAEKLTMQSKIEQYTSELKKAVEEMADLQALLEKKSQDNVELIDRVKASKQATNKAEEHQLELEQRVEQLLKELEETKMPKEKKTSESSTTSSTGKQSDDEFIVVREGDALTSAPTTPPSKEELKDKIVELENRVSELTLENGSLALNLQDREMEKELATNVLRENLQALQVCCEEKEEQLKAAKEHLEEQQEKMHDLKEKAAEAVIAQEKLKLLTEEKTKIAAEIEKMKGGLNNMQELQNRLLISEREKESLQLEMQTLRTAQEKIKELESKLQKLTLDNQQLQLNAEAETETLNNSAELEDKMKLLADENDNLRAELESVAAQAKFRQAIAEEKKEITDLDADEEESFNMEKLRELLSTYVKLDTQAEANDETLNKTYKVLRDRLWKIDTLEKNLAQMSEEIVDLQDNKLVWDHEKKTLEADISQYILQCDELMKNNEILLNELENYRRNKLETIHEHNEENVLQLELQLEECSKLNRSLETEYAETSEKIDDLEREKQILTENLRAAQQQNKELHTQARDYSLQVETLDLEKCNLLFELNELQTNREKETEHNEALQQAEEKCQSLQSQLELLCKDHADLVAAMQAQKATLQETLKKREEVEHVLNEREKIFVKLAEELQTVKTSTRNNEEFESKLQQMQELEKQPKQELIAKDLIVESLMNENRSLQESRKDLDSLALKEKRLLEQEKIISQLQEELNLKVAHEMQFQKELEVLIAAQKQLVSVEAYEKLQEQNINLEKSLEELKALQETQNVGTTVAATATQDDTNAEARITQLEAELLASAELKNSIETLNYEKNEMIKALQQKHAENMQYYLEIQRLQPIIQQLQQQQQLSAEVKNCDKCTVLETSLADMKKEQEKLQDQINFLKEKSDILTTNLLTEQTNQKLVQQEKLDLMEQNATIRKDVERLRQHLLEIEDMHTQESVEMQRELDETKAKMIALQEDVSQSSNAYTSASIRANQHAETLQAQYALVIQQRDELVAKLSLAEDRESKNQAALCNLQCALEQFQNDKENDIKTATLRIRRELQQELNKEAHLQGEITALNKHLTEANEGLRAASRLSDQLEACQQTIAALREEVETLKQQKHTLQAKLDTSESSQTDKIEKSLIKSLLIGYVVSGNPNDKHQVLRMISSVLDFTQNESDKVGLNKQQQSGWLGSLLGSNSTQAGSQSRDNLVQAFVQFLEQESQPKSPEHMPNLLNITQSTATATTTASAGSTSTSTTNQLAPMRRISATTTSSGSSIVTPIPIQPFLNSNVLNEFAPTRNSSSILKDILSDS